MKQKLAIISAWLHEPELIIMDEPFVGLDPKASHLLKEMSSYYPSVDCIYDNSRDYRTEFIWWNYSYAVDFHICYDTVLFTWIFLCFLDLCLEHNGMDFECTHFVDNGSDEEKIIVATYHIAFTLNEFSHEYAAYEVV